MAVSVYFRHENVRDSQNRLISDIADCLEEGKHLVAHAPTGLGKTDASIAPALKFAIENDKTVFFCTPKIAQHKIAVEVVKGIAEKYELDAMAIDIVGKKNLCIDESMHDLSADAFYELCRKRRKNKSCPHYGFARGYNIRQRSEAKSRIDSIREWYKPIKEHGELIKYCERYKEKGFIRSPCAYETVLQLGEKANIVICDYYHILNPHIADTFLTRMEKELEDSVVVIDEAHNSPDRLRKAFSVSLNSFVLKRAMNECVLVGNPVLEKLLAGIEKELEKVEKKLDKHDKDEILVRKNDVPLFDSQFLNDLYETGMLLLESTNRSRSYLFSILRFYEGWMRDSEAFLRVAKKTSYGASVENLCLDPSIITAARLNMTSSAILMSGTLKPGEMYRDLLGLDENRTVVKEYSSPFPRENQLNILVRDVTTKYEKRTEQEFEKIAKNVNDVVNSTPGNVAVFFPSYKMMGYISPMFSFNKPVVNQEGGSGAESNRKTLDLFKAYSGAGGAVLVGVTGGSFAEGIDFPGEELLGVVIVGVPLKEPDLETNALIRYYDKKFGKGWEYGYTFPAMSKTVQAAGRLIRNETDRGVAAFLDTRFGWRKYSKCFPRNYDFKITSDPKSAVDEFWSTNPSEFS